MPRLLSLPRGLCAPSFAFAFFLCVVSLLPSTAAAQPTRFGVIPSWEGWENLGGTVSNVQCLSSGDSRLECFAIGRNDFSLQRRWWDGSSWQGWTAAGGVQLDNSFGEAPHCVMLPGVRFHCFVKGTDRQLHHRWFDATGFSWWEGLGGQIASEPSCVASPQNRIDCFATGDNGALFRQTLAGGRWSGWIGEGGIADGTRDDSATKPACALRSNAQIDCVVVARGAKTLQHFAFSIANGTGAWSTPDFGSPTAALVGTAVVAPKCYSGQTNEIMCMVPADGLGLVRATLGASGWQFNNIVDALDANMPMNSYDFDCIVSANGASACFELIATPVSSFGSRFVFREFVGPQTSQGGWREIGFPQAAPTPLPFVSRLSCVSWGPGRIDCFASAGAMWHVWRPVQAQRFRPGRPIRPINPSVPPSP